MTCMILHRAVVRDGRLILDEPTDLPEGEVIDLRYDGPDGQTDDFDNLTLEDRTRLDASIDRGIADARAGRTISAERFLEEIEAL